MVNKANLEVSAERVTDKELEQRFNDINKEIQQIGGVNEKDHEIKIVQGSLNGQFAEFLLRPEYRQPLLSLIDVVKKLKSDWSNLGSKAGKGLDDLATFLDDIDPKNIKNMEKDYNEFIDRLDNNPKRLSRMDSKKIRRLNLYLGMYPEKAKDAYVLMKALPENWANSSQDTMFYNSVWGTLKNNYANHPDFVKNDYHVLDGLNSEVNNLKKVAGENWDGKSENITVPEAKNSIVDINKVNEIVRKANEERIAENEKKLQEFAIDVDSLDDNLLSKFIKTKDDKLKYDGDEFKEDEFSVDGMMKLFGDKINEAAGDNFVSPDEKKSLIDKFKGIIFEKLRNDLWASDKVEKEKEQEDTVEAEAEKTIYNSPKIDIQIKDEALKGKIKELHFCEDLDKDPVEFDISEVKRHLETLKDRSRSKLKSDKLEKETWLIAVQIALMYLMQKEREERFNVKYIDGIIGKETRKGVTGFQERYGLRFIKGKEDKNGKPDGLPGRVTISKLVAVLGNYVAGEQPTETSDGAQIYTEVQTQQSTQNPDISGKINSVDNSNPVLDLSDLTSLKEEDVTQIITGLNDKLNGQTLSNPLLIKLDRLESLDSDVAQKLSDINGKISLKTILNGINFDDNCDEIVGILKTLAPDDKKLIIVAPTQKICENLQEKGVKNVEFN